MKTFVFVPHQDDEVNLIGNCVDSFLKISDVYIVYSSIDRDAKKANIRKDEAQRACKILGIKASNVIFLDFPDTPNREGHHFFADKREQVVEKLINVLLKYKPEIIIGTDFDFHSDHRMLSLALDCALEKVIKESFHNYRPLYLKGFCYETAYYGKEDYFSSRNAKTEPVAARLSNPYFKWENRVSIASEESNHWIWQKKAFKALCQHKSQYAVFQAESIINKDNVFWIRRTDNLLLNSETKITTSSGNPDKLNDFLLLDTDDIITIDPQLIDYSRSSWLTNTQEKELKIYIDFDREYELGTICFYQMINSKINGHVCGYICIDGFRKQFTFSGGDALSYCVSLDGVRSRFLEIIFDEPVELTEIELFTKEDDEITKQLLFMLKNESRENAYEFFLLGKIFYDSFVAWLKIKRKIKRLLKSYK